MHDLGVGEWGVLETAFDSRVRARFPPGTTEAVLRATLNEQGFSPPERVPAEAVRLGPFAGRESYASYLEWGQGPCNIGAQVMWTSDAAGRLIEARGFYGERGCL